MPDYFDIGLLREKPAWHKKGQVLTATEMDTLTVVDAFNRGGVNFPIKTAPVFSINPENSEFVKLPDKKLIMRGPMEGDDSWKGLGVVSDSYKVVQPLELAELLEPLRESWPIETVFSLRQGSRVAVTFKMDSVDLMGDEGEKTDFYFFVADDYMGNAAISTMVTPVRVVCQNTWTAAFNTNKGLTSFSHMGDPKKMIELRTALEAVAARNKRKAVEQFEAMMKKALSVEDKASIIEAAYPDPGKPKILRMKDSAEWDQVSTNLRASAQVDIIEAIDRWERAKKRTQDRRVSVGERLGGFNDKHPVYANTVYAVMNAVTEEADWGKGHEAGRANSVLFGSRMQTKSRAQRQAVKLLKA